MFRGAEHFVRKGGSRLVECRDPSFSCQNLKSVMDASSHGPMTAGPVERPPAPPAASHSRRRTRSMSAHESLTGERDGGALVAPTLTDHQGDVACDDPQSYSPEPIPRCARVPDPRAHLDDTDAQPADPSHSTAACQVRVISTTSTAKTSPAEAADLTDLWLHSSPANKTGERA